MAGLVHLGAARSHQGDPLLVKMFVATAVAQLLVGALLIVTARRLVLVAALTVNGCAVAAWILSRTVGVPFVDSLASPESIGSQDLAAASFAAASMAATLVVLFGRPARVVLTPAWTGAIAMCGLLAALPAVSATHTHDHGGVVHLESAAHAHGDDVGHALDGADAGHGHARLTRGGEHPHEGAPGEAPHEHDPGSGDVHAHAAGAAPHGEAAHDPGTAHDPTAGHGPLAPHDPAVPHDPVAPHHPVEPDDPTATGPIVSVDDPRLTPAQRATALRLISEMKAAMLAYPSTAVLEAAGYRSIGDGGTVG
jgi:hypothetical protein